MTSERWQQISAIYQQAAARSGKDRDTYLKDACDGDPELRREIDLLLAQGDSFLANAVRLPLGSRIGAYELLEVIGAGGMGIVYRARDSKLQRDVALKVLPEAMALDPDRIARFRREATVLASLNHPNIGAIYGFEDSGDVHALVLELVDGPTLADRIAQGRIPVDEALPIARQIAEALEAAHDQGIIHRDLKPVNIKLRPDGTVKVLDFGLAKALDPVGSGQLAAGNASLSPTITSPALVSGVGVLLGTAAYMSPEQARGRPVDRRSDIWAFGCVLYEMLTSTRAFEDEDVSMTLSKVLQREPDFDLFPPDVPPRVQQTVRLCLRKPLRERIPDIGAVRLSLAGAFETVASRISESENVRPLSRRALPIAVTAVVTIVAMTLAVWRLWPTTPPASVTRFDYVLPRGQVFRNANRTVLAFSPDGRHFVYNSAGGLYLRSMDTLDAHLIPGTEGPATSNPFFSPDGASVGFFETGQLKRISTSGGAAAVICAASNPFGVSWSPDNTILFGQSNGIMRVSANGGTPELVIPAKQGEQVDGPQLLPDNDSVLFSVATATGLSRWDTAQIVVQSLSNGKRKVLLRGGSDARYLRSGHLVYARGNALFAVPFALGRLEVKGGPVSVVQGLARAGNLMVNPATANYALSDGGTLVYVNEGAFGGFLAPVAPSTLVWVDRQGHEEALKAPPRAYVYPRLSPDGTRIALDSRDQGFDIWLWDQRRQTLTRVTFDPALDTMPVWTPDGRRLVWASQRDGALNLYWQPADGTGAVERLTKSPNAQRASSFAPDGTRLLLSEIPQQGGLVGRANLAMLSLDGDRPVKPLLPTMFTERNGEVSADGRWLAYESDESGQFQIYVQPFPAVDQGRWQVSTSGGRQPVWARSGRELFYVAPDGALMGVSVDVGQPNAAHFAAGAPEKLVSGSGYYYAGSDFNQGRTYDVSADGTRFLRLKLGDSSNGAQPVRITVVQNWTEELNRVVPIR